MEIKKDAWDNFMTSFDYESDVNNFKHDFKHMTRYYGVAYIEYCRAMWSANEGIHTEDEFCKMNGNMPKGFFDKTIKGK
tara:strand:- start:13397 stop:13633 length:237 start_codon:yes stop_codon:yes gene_type:complete